ncbi:MAG: ATP-binding protein [Verrucomicrobiales bacterium]|nr:ATP-binding protein [Verrucomicrobiales bacterium]
MDFQIEIGRTKVRTGKNAAATAAPRWLAGVRAGSARAECAPTTPPRLRPPWPGLSPFRVADRTRLFGRTREIRALAAHFDRSGDGRAPVACLIGDSGAGKTSLVMAGLIPALFAGTDHRHTWIRIDPPAMGEADSWVEAVAAGILRRTEGREDDRFDAEGRLRQFGMLWRQDSPEAAAEYLASCWRRDHGAGARCLLILDPFDPVLSRDGAGSVVRLLDDLSLTGAFSVLVVMRSAHLAAFRQVAGSAGVPDWGRPFRVGRPAARWIGRFLSASPDFRMGESGRRVDPALLAEGEREIARFPGLLPFFSQFLSDLALRNPGADWLKDPAGGWEPSMKALLVRAGNAAVAEFDSEMLRDALSRLIEALPLPDDASDESPSIRWSELVATGDEGLRRLVEALIEARILLLNGGEKREARLSWAWPPGVKAWAPVREAEVERYRQMARLEQFREAKRRWETDRRSVVRLLHASRQIDDARTWLAAHARQPCLEGDLVAYLEESVALDDRIRQGGRVRERRRRATKFGLVAGAVVVLLLALAAWF